MMRLLVSVRSTEEAMVAVAAGADLIDVKEPANGPLGRADDEVIDAVVTAVAGRVPVSVALGELAAYTRPPPLGISFAKIGLLNAGPDWPLQWSAWRASLPYGCQPVAVAYAEGPSVAAPAVEAVVRLAAQERAGAMLIDTAIKCGQTLLDHLSLCVLESLMRQLRQADVPIALAGSLTAAELPVIRDLNPTWIGVRGAACRAGRETELDAQRIGHLRQLLKPPCLAGPLPVRSAIQ